MKKDLVLGVDFGTTNSSAAIYDEGQIKLVDIDTHNTNKKTLKSSIFITPEHEVHLGQKAIDEYIDKFEGHEIKTDTQLTDDWMDVIRSVEGETTRERLVEEFEINLPGRFILSPKRVLPNRFFHSTEAFGKQYTAEDLAYFILKRIKDQAEQAFDQEITRVNVGRPVHFSDDLEGDNLAVERLSTALTKAGFKDFTFTYEPVGAAHSYAIQNNQRKLGIVFDFGGGTFDTSIIEFMPDHSINVIANAGVYVGGNKLNENFIYHKFLHHFGRDVLWGPNDMGVPRWIMDAASRWEMSAVLRRRTNIDLIESIRRQTDNPVLIENLLHLIRQNLGLSLFLLAEKSKIDLTNMNPEELLELAWQRDNIQIAETINKAEFQNIIWNDVARIAQSMRMVIEQAEIQYSDIDVVIKTGGSSRAYFVNDFLKEIFNNAEIYTGDAFTDVTAGLAIAANND